MRDDGKVASRGEGIGTFLSTHPDPVARITSTEQRLMASGMEVKIIRQQVKEYLRTNTK